MATRLTARELIALIGDQDSFVSWDQPIDTSSASESYLEVLSTASERSGTDESVLTGTITIDGYRLAIIVSEFGFLAGSVGQAAADRIVAGIERATAESLPLLGATASGGTRMQEGTNAFVKMVDIARAIRAHRASGCAYLAYLRHPTTGGVFATWGSLAQVTWAEPGALVGFLGPKVYEQLYHEPFPSGIQQSENLATCGIIDAVLAPQDLRTELGRVLSVITAEPNAPELPEASGAQRTADSWTAIARTRDPSRPGVREVLRRGCTVVVELHGTTQGEDDPAMVLALARFDGQPCVIIGQDRIAQREHGPMGPAGLRIARRGMRLATELHLPLVSFIDTPGAELSVRAEEGAMAGEIARSIADMATLSVPSVSVLLGEGSGGGALALLPATVKLSTQNSWLSPLPPEGASVIVHGNVEHADELARSQRVGAAHMLQAGIIDGIIDEPTDPDSLVTAVASAVSHTLARIR